MEKASRRIISMPVYSINEGQYLGNVKNLVVDPQQKRLIALLVEQRQWGKNEKIIPFAKVKNIGDDAITIDKSAGVERKTNMPQILHYMQQPAAIHGAKVLTDGGKTVGRVEEYYLDTQNGQISHLEVGSSLFRSRLALSAQDVITIAARAIIVANGALERAEVVETGAGGGARGLLSGAVAASKRISRSLADSINRYKAAQARAEQDDEDEDEDEEIEAGEGVRQEKPADDAIAENDGGDPAEERKV
ncbi:MAG: PRC-barrel domain-containing protein [Clostridiales bacterium]|nr:PRC-barrel domain-containing protein [Clostridiales bacterium]